MDSDDHCDPDQQDSHHVRKQISKPHKKSPPIAYAYVQEIQRSGQGRSFTKGLVRCVRPRRPPVGNKLKPEEASLLRREHRRQNSGDFVQ
jgi:hypothetical protein